MFMANAAQLGLKAMRTAYLSYSNRSLTYCQIRQQASDCRSGSGFKPAFTDACGDALRPLSLARLRSLSYTWLICGIHKFVLGNVTHRSVVEHDR